MADDINITLRVDRDTAVTFASLLPVLGLAKPAPQQPGIEVREIGDTVELRVPAATRKLLMDFGWQPPVDEDGE